MNTREKQCIYYLNEGNCARGHAGTFKKTCQICKDYKMKKNAIPRRKDLRKQKIEKWEKDKKNWE